MHHENETDTNLPNQAEVGGGRRRWIGHVIALAVAAPFAVLFRLFTSSRTSRFSTTVKVGMVEELFRNSDWNETTVVGQHILLTKSNADVTAHLLRCTHSGCPLKVSPKGIVCHCHGGTFSLQGQPTGGPPKEPLKQLESVVHNGNVYVRVQEGG